ncbi:MAG: phosphonate metabolism protein/1,5-bisphosphokinase (PRPP-forming) PhnN [Rhabdaerophilum calidifontis]
MPEIASSASATAPETGILVLVVGPSGAGKDTLMNAARASLSARSGLVFVRRAITRPRDGATEDHLPMTEAEFMAAEAAGAFCLAWQAHGLRYGVPAAIIDELRLGRTVIVNLSRAVIPAAEALWPRVLVLNVTAPPALLASRLAARGREDAADIAARLAREAPLAPARAKLVTIVNDGPVEAGAAAVVAALRGG